MGASPSQHLSDSSSIPAAEATWPLQDDMGVVIGLPPATHPLAAAPSDGYPTVGKRVLGVLKGSPAAKAGLVPWLDFVVGADGRLFVGDEEVVLEPKSLVPGKKLKLHVFNIKTSSVRDCVVVPSERVANVGENGNHLNGGGTEGASTTANMSSGGFLGLRISSWQAPDGEGLDKSLRVMAVVRASPAQECGLEPEKDYLLGTVQHGPFASIDDLEYALLDKEGSVLDIYVYNSLRDDVRIVNLRPRTGWSPYGGLLGAELAHGILHRVPASGRRTVGRDRETAGEQSISQSDIVRTPEGLGELLVRHSDGSATVRLDWGLGNDCQVIGKFAAKHVDFVAS